MIQNICHLIASRGHGSIEKHLADLSRWQAHNTGAQVAVIAQPRYREAFDREVGFVPRRLLLESDEIAHLAEQIGLALGEKEALRDIFAGAFSRAESQLTLGAMASTTWSVPRELVPGS